jgi:hypothetical protein
MSAKPQSFFDTFTDKEAALMETIMAELKNVEWAQPLLREIEANGGLCGANMARFFELRQGYALRRAGIKPSYEIAGEGDSTIDFGFTANGQAWNVEMMRFMASDAAKAATTTEVDEHGTTWTKRILSGDNKDKKQSPEGEMLKAIERVCQKCEKDGKPYKFPLPGTAFNALIVDTRTFGNRGADRKDCLHIGLGATWLKPHLRLSWGEKENRKLITGVYWPHTAMKGAKEARERLHFIGFVNARNFTQDEHGASIEFIANPHLLKNVRAMRAAADTWPLSSRFILNGIN